MDSKFVAFLGKLFGFTSKEEPSDKHLSLQELALNYPVSPSSEDKAPTRPPIDMSSTDPATRYGFQEVLVVEGQVSKISDSTPISTVPELSPFQKAKANFHPAKDMLVISESKYKSLDAEAKEWVDSLGEKAFFLKHGSQTNVAVLRSW